MEAVHEVEKKVENKVVDAVHGFEQKVVDTVHGLENKVMEKVHGVENKVAASTIAPTPSLTSMPVAKARKYSCSVGQGEHGVTPIKISEDNSEEACGHQCDVTDGCVGFDWSANRQNNSCKLFRENQPRTSGGPGKRHYCKLQEDIGAPVPERVASSVA